MKRSTKIRFITTRGFHAVLPCRAATVPPDPQLCGRDPPPPPGLDRVVLAEAEPRPAGPFILVYLRKGETFADLAAGFGVGTSTAWRYVQETVALLPIRAPKLRKAMREAKKAGYAYVALDGTLIPIDRVAADRPFYSGKHSKHGMNLQVIASPDRRYPLGLRAAARSRPRHRRPRGSGHPATRWRPPAWSPWPTRATRAPRHARTPYKGKNKPESQKQANRAHAKLRSPGERANANAQLKTQCHLA